jgi:hypothetical protein
MRRLWVVAALSFAMGLPAAGQTTPPAGEKCASMARIALPNVKMTSAELMTATESNTLPEAKELEAIYQGLPAFCRVAVEDTPSSNSNIKIEIWLPAAGWNGKYRGQGNGGFAGVIDYRAMAAAVREGYATAGTDTGHTDTGHMGLDASFALDHPEKVKDFGWRAIHEMTLKAKAITAAYYGEQPKRSYFASCSDGGREALMEAQRFPRDYDGILAGDPANDWTRLLAAAMWDVHGMFETADSYIPARKVPAIAAAVLVACDAQDGVRDGVLNDPRRCRFDPGTMLCKHGDADTCLLPAQVETLKNIYAGPRDAKGKQIFPGYLPGAEDGQGGWIPWITGPAPHESMFYFFGVGYFSNFVYEKKNWDYRTYNLDQALNLADKKTALALNATDPDLEPFFAHGGKLILYHGWNDPAIPALSTIDYYNAVVNGLGKKSVDTSLRLYMVPGMHHCEGGPGATDFGQDPAAARGDAQHDVFTALEQWAENGVDPGHLIAKKFVAGNPAKGVAMSRPLCPYPMAAKYTGKGNTNKARNFVCAAEQ